MLTFKKFFVTLALLLVTTSTCAAANSNMEPLAAGYVDGENQILMLVKNKTDGGLYFVPFDSETETGAFIKFDRKIYDFYLNRDNYGGFSPLIFVMATPRQADPVDDRLGVWNGDVHLIPVYALFDVRDGKIVFDAPNFYSGAGTITPSHYHSNIKNPIHARLIETLMTKMPLLHADVESKSIVLP